MDCLNKSNEIIKKKQEIDVSSIAFDRYFVVILLKLLNRIFVAI